MRLLLSALLGVLQGLTEFLPVSSDGHLAILHAVADPLPGDERLAFDVLLHGGTLLSLLVFFRGEIVRLAKALAHLRDESDERRMIVAVVVGSVPTAIIGLLLKRLTEEAGYRVAASFMIVTGVILLATRFSPAARGRPPAPLSWKTGLLTGTAQGLAVLPGLSRSASTITTGLFAGLSAPEAFRFSFLLAIPANLGALLLESRQIATIPVREGIVGVVAAFAVGLVALRFLSAVVARGKLHWFAVYCIPVGGAALVAGWALGWGNA